VSAVQSRGAFCLIRQPTDSGFGLFVLGIPESFRGDPAAHAKQYRDKMKTVIDSLS